MIIIDRRIYGTGRNVHFMQHKETVKNHLSRIKNEISSKAGIQCLCEWPSINAYTIHVSSTTCKILYSHANERLSSIRVRRARFPSFKHTSCLTITQTVLYFSASSSFDREQGRVHAVAKVRNSLTERRGLARVRKRLYRENRSVSVDG